MVLLQLQMDNLIHHSLFHGLQGNLCSSPWCTSCIPSLMLVSAGQFLTIVVITPYCLCSIWPFLNTFSQGTSNFATGLSCVLHWVFWSCLCPAQGSPWPFLTKATPAASTLPVPYILHPVFDANELTRTESKTAGVGVKAEECFTDLFDE